MGTVWIERNGLAWEESSLLAAAGICHGVTGRSGGVSRAPWTSLNLSFDVGDQQLQVLENRRRLCQAIGTDVSSLTVARTVDGDHVTVVGEAERGCGAGSSADGLPHTDALVTNVPGIPLMICAADSVPVILADPVRQAVAVIHAGLRGTAARITAKTVLAMELVYGSRPEQLLAYVGPAAAVPHLEVSKGVAASFVALGPAYASCIQQDHGRRLADSKGANWQMLLDVGLRADHIDTSSADTAGDSRFFSHRRDFGHTGRMAAFVMMRKD